MKTLNHIFVRVTLATLITGVPVAANADSFVTTGPLITARGYHRAVLLQNGKVLVTGGFGGSSTILSTAELYDSFMGTWTFTGGMNYPRSQHTLTLLTNGQVLTVGGYGQGGYLSTVELYNPVSTDWSVATAITGARQNHTATLLPNGLVLVAGGYGPGGVTSSARLFDPGTVSGTWTTTGVMGTPRHSHAAVLLPDGKVLVAGGRDSGYLSSAELYDPVSQTWSPTIDTMDTPRTYHTATLLPNGHVLVTGGQGSSGYLSSCEIYNPETQVWSPTAPLAAARHSHTATLLPNGKVLIAGGRGTANSYLASAELYDPSTGTWTATGSLIAGRFSHTATLLPNGNVLAVGGMNGSGYLASSERNGPALADPKTPGGFSFATVNYASTGVQVYGRYLNPTPGYSINRRLDLSPFYDGINSAQWGFDAHSVPINGVLKIPSGPGPFPVAIIAHGWRNVHESELGLTYLCELLASWGILAAAVDVNFFYSAIDGDVDARGILDLEHVRQLELWNATPGHPLFGKVDLSRVMIAGHSRGGEAAAAASYFNRYTGSDPVPLDGSAGLGPYDFGMKAVVAMAPTEGMFVPASGSVQVEDNYLLISGSQDSEVPPIQGLIQYERAQFAEGFKVFAYLFGGNHSQFNSDWEPEGAAPNLSREQQEGFAKLYISAMAQVTLLDKPEYLTFLKDHREIPSWLPTTDLTQQYQQSGSLFFNHYEEDANTVTLSPPVVGANSWNAAVTASEGFLWESPYEINHGLNLSWTTPAGYYETSFNSPGLDAGAYHYLALRIGQTLNYSLNPPAQDQNLRIAIRDSAGASAVYTVTAFSRLPFNTLLVPQTIRIPLNLLRSQGVNVSKLSSVKLLFDQTSTGELRFDDMQLTD